VSKAPQGRGSGVGGRGYQQLRAWQSAHQLALAAFRVSERLRPRHRWLADQLVRAAVSVAANIAEGYNRGSLREYVQFLSIARGSLAEVEYYTLFAGESELLLPEQASAVATLIDSTASPLIGLIRSLQAKTGGAASRVMREDFAGYIADDLAAAAPPTPDPRPPTPPESP